LHGGVTPVAFCITPDGAPDAGLASETREGLPIVHWAKNGMSYMVIGDIPNEQLVGMAEALRSQL
jgi:anti-sigma factor RsiW